MAPMAQAEGLSGRQVIFNAIAWDDPTQPYITSRDYGGTVGEGPEFTMLPEGYPDLDIVPVEIDVSADRITFSYHIAHEGAFAVAAFNGYVLRFPAECTLITGAAIDPAGTTLPLGEDALTTTPNSLSLNLSGLEFSTLTRIAVTLSVTDCLMG